MVSQDRQSLVNFINVNNLLYLGRVLLGAMYLIAGIARITAIVAFFTAPLGLFDIYIGFNPDPPFVSALNLGYVPLETNTLGKPLLIFKINTL